MRSAGAFMTDYKLSPYDAGVLVAERESADFFEGSGEEAATARRRRIG